MLEPVGTTQLSIKDLEKKGSNMYNSIDGDRRILKIVTTLAVAVFLQVLGAVSTAQERPLTLGPVLLFPFNVVGDDKPGDYQLKAFYVGMDSFSNALRESYAIRGLKVYKEEVPPDLDLRHRIGQEMRVGHIVGVFFEPVEKNVLVTASWFDLARETDGRKTIALGPSVLEDFGLINERMRELAAHLVNDMIRSRTGRTDVRLDAASDIIQITCFSGGASVDQPHLDRFLTLEFPQYLAQALEARGVLPDGVRVRGLFYDDYGVDCQGFERQYKNFNPRAKPQSDARFSISGSVLPGKEGFWVRSTLWDGLSGWPLVVGDFHVKGEIETVDLPRLVAEGVAERLKIFFVQIRLAESGLDPGELNGELHEKTTAALESLQRDRGLQATGIIDPDTLKALGLR